VGGGKGEVNGCCELDGMLESAAEKERGNTIFIGSLGGSHSLIILSQNISCPNAIRAIPKIISKRLVKVGEGVMDESQ